MELQRTELGKSYWNQTGVYQKEYDELWGKLVPGVGQAETLHGELLRGASRLGYEYYNNGNGNARDISYTEVEQFIGYDDEGNEEYEYYEEEDEVKIDEFFQSFIDLIRENVEGTESCLKKIEELIECQDRYKYSNEEESCYIELMDRVIHFVLTNVDKPLPYKYKDTY